MTASFEEFHAAHHGERPLLLPNAWDHSTARLLVAEGFRCIGTTSLGVAAAHGLPDATGAAREETVALARGLARYDALITVDIESGFSDDPSQVADLAVELTEFGVVGVNIEDGRPDGTLASPERLSASITAIKDRAPKLFVNARTDAYWLGCRAPRTEALRRAGRYQAAGADGIFVPGANAPEDITALVAGVDLPVNVLFSPDLGLTALAELGVARISTGSLLFRAALGAVLDVLSAIDDEAALPGNIPSYTRVQQLSG